MKETVGAITKPMTRDEALEILNISAEDADIESVEEGKSEAIPELIMSRFETLAEKNGADRGGSFYIRSKIYFAKEQLMVDFPVEFNESQFNPGAA